MIDGFWGGVLNEKELDACCRVTRVYSKRFENPENLFGVYSPQPQIIEYIFFPRPANCEVVREFARKVKK